VSALFGRHEVDRHDLQGNVLAGYGNDFANALFAFVRVGEGAAGRRFLGDLLAQGVTNAVPWSGVKPDVTLNIALTYEGFAALGVPEPILSTFPSEFRDGMASRAQRLGDVGPNAPDRWQLGLREGEPHVLVTVFARDPTTLLRRRDELRAVITRPASGLALIHEQEVELLDHPTEAAYSREHFGFADGLAQPSIRGSSGPWTRQGMGTPLRFGRWRNVAPGEFVVGYRDEDGIVSGGVAEPLGRSGSFTVVRKLYQDVALFNRYLRARAQGDPWREALLGAKMVGRWRDGTPLVLSPEGPDERIATDRGRRGRINDFRYGSDRDGLRCPLGAHIRRANPRDALGWQGRLIKRHRIIRRGMPYGPRPLDPWADDGRDRGLIFVCHQASIERQFEVVQGSWMADGDAFGLGHEADFLLAGENGPGKMIIQGHPPTFLSPRAPFVRLRGGGYFFTPGISALTALSTAAYPL
jgi:Dyp-type peroxidase family